MPVLGDVFDVDQGEERVTAREGRPVGPHWAILTLHYLGITSRPERLIPEVTFADLPAARSYAEVYRAQDGGPLVRHGRPGRGEAADRGNRPWRAGGGCGRRWV